VCKRWPCFSIRRVSFEGGKRFRMSRYFKNLFNKREPNHDVVNPGELSKQPLPRHISIIMDGNGRWAQKKGLPRAAGHRAGVEALTRVVDACLTIGIKYLTVYAFSTENWKRPKDEVDTLMNLLVEYVEKELAALEQNGVRVSVLGNIGGLPKNTQKQIHKALEKTNRNMKLNLQIALNYGGRTELVEAVRIICQGVKQGNIKPEEVNEEMIANNLYTAGLPDPDLMIRSSGEMRISNFLLWQSAYTEYWVTDTLWPDFSASELYRAIYDYQQRHRRYGGL